MNTFYRKVLQVALVSRNGGSIFPEGWLSLTGTVAHFDPEYSVLHNKAYITIKAGNTFSNPQYNKEYDSELRHFDYIVANPPFGAASAGGKRRPGLLGKNCSRELLHEVVTKAINEAFREKEAILPLLRGNIVISLEEVTSNQIAAIDEQMRSMQQELLATIN